MGRIGRTWRAVRGMSEKVCPQPPVAELPLRRIDGTAAPQDFEV